MGVITWNGVASDTLGIFVEKYPSYNGTSRRYETVNVPGRNGTLLFDLGSYDSVVQEYDIAVIGNGPDVARNVRAWLLGTIGYARLSDSYESGYFRNAYYDGPINIENVLNNAGRATIRFVCGPERYLTSGETDLTIPKSNDGTTTLDIDNTYTGDALPIIEIRNTSGAAVSGTVQIYDDVDAEYDIITVTNWSQGQKLYIDSLLKDCYNASYSQNSLVTFNNNRYPILEVGHTFSLHWTGSFSSVVIRPRWWVL